MTSVIGEEFRRRYLSQPGSEGVFEARAIVFDGSDDYHHRINETGERAGGSQALSCPGAARGPNGLSTISMRQPKSTPPGTGW